MARLCRVTWTTLLLILTLAVTPVWADDDGDGWLDSVDPSAGYLYVGAWFGTIDTEIFDKDDGDILATEIDLEDDLDIDQENYIPWIEATIGGRFRFGAGYMWYERDGLEDTIDKTIRFRNQPVASPGDSVEVDESLTLIDAWMEFEVLSKRGIRTGLMAGAKYYRHFIKINNVTTSLEVDRTTETILPWIGVYAEVNAFTDFLTVHAQVRWADYSFSEIDIERGEWIEVRGGAGFWPIPEVLGLVVEYRVYEFRVEKIPDPDEETDFSFRGDGLSVFAVLRF